MVVKDLSNSFYPVPKNKMPSKIKVKKSKSKSIIDKKIKETKLVTDFCIMPKSTKYSTKRTRKYNNRHEVFFGRAYRNKSIKDGLIVFLTNEDHEGTNGVHGKNGDKLNRYLKRTAQKAWMSYYSKTEEEFRTRFGKIN